MLNVYIAIASIQVYRSLGRHVVALEEKKDLFVAVLVPIVRIPTRNPNSKLRAAIPSEDPDAMDIVPAIIFKNTLINKFTLCFDFCNFLSHLLDCITSTLIF
jgi:hypothetical protein